MKCVTGLGLDIVKTSRITKILKKANAPRFLERVLSVSEISELEKKIQSISIEDQKMDITAQFLANRWAVKEALVKAMDKRDLDFKSVSLCKSESGRPFLGFEQGYLESSDSFEVSISHEDDVTAAVVIRMTMINV